MRWQQRYSEQASVWQVGDIRDVRHVAARTRINSNLNMSSRVAASPVIRWHEPQISFEYWSDTNAVTQSGSETRRYLDDFSIPIERRRFHARRWLDDFAPIVIWTEG